MRSSDWSSDVCSSDLFGTVLKLRSVLAPSPRDLVPFVLMLAIHTRLNPEALLGSNQEDFGTEDRLGETRFRAGVTKGRRSDESRVGKECVSTCRDRRSAGLSNKKTNNNRRCPP